MDAFVQLIADGTGKKIQSFENTIGVDVVEAIAVKPVAPAGLGDRFVRINNDSSNTGKKIQHFRNTIAGNVVNALAVVLVDPAGVPL